MDNRIITSDDQLFDIRFWQRVFRLNTCIPAIVDGFDATTQRVAATPAIRGKFIDTKNNVSYIDLPKITNIPLAITKSAGIKITYPIEIGQNCTLIFSQRSIDNFILDGGIQNPYDGPNPKKTQIRCMDMTDALCFPGVITDAETITDYATDAIEIRSADNTTKVSVKEKSLKLLQGSASIELSEGNIDMTAATINITGTSAVNISSPDTKVGTATTIDTKVFLQHTHPYTAPAHPGGTSDTGGVS